MDKLIANDWRRQGDAPYERARILRHDVHPEGLDVERVRFLEGGPLQLTSAGATLTVIGGGGSLLLAGSAQPPLRLEAGVHVYVPPGAASRFEADAATELVLVTVPSAERARGDALLVRDELFLAACASGSHSLRWVLTPQYLSRRVFLHHDRALLSRSGDPVSWFHTTMFDVSGLPPNADGESVFKMSYNSKTEINVCHDVVGEARVRMARHPYAGADQAWDPWCPLDGQSSYHLNEAADGPEVESFLDELSKTRRTLRNKHEVRIADGHVSLFCLFDPAPTGIERHRPGEYSDYEPLAQVIGRSDYETYRREIELYDAMVDTLSLARARGELEAQRRTPLWELYERGRDAQIAIEGRLCETLHAEGAGRDRVLERWMRATAATAVGGPVSSSRNG